MAVTSSETAARITPSVVAEVGEARVFVSETSALSKGLATAGRVFGGPEAGALITAAGGAYGDINSGTIRQGRDLWVATTLDSFVGAGISVVADAAGITTGVVVTGLAIETGPAAPFIGTAAGVAVAGGTAYTLGAAWNGVRNDAINLTVSGINAVEGAYNRVSSAVENLNKGYCLFYCQ